MPAIRSINRTTPAKQPIQKTFPRRVGAETGGHEKRTGLVDDSAAKLKIQLCVAPFMVLETRCSFSTPRALPLSKFPPGGSPNKISLPGLFLPFARSYESRPFSARCHKPSVARTLPSGRIHHQNVSTAGYKPESFPLCTDNFSNAFLNTGPVATTGSKLALQLW